MKLRKLSTVFVAVLMLLGYQNCSPVRFSEFGLLTEKGITLDNGNGYGGKLRGQFYRFQAGFTCENKESFFSSIEVSDAGTTYLENSLPQCSSARQDLDPTLIDESIFQHDIIGYREGIFEGAASTPTSIPANLVEVWCRNSKDVTGIETVTHFNHTTAAAQTEIYSDLNGVIQKQTQTVSRVVSAQTVTVRGGDGLLIEVYRDRPAAEFGLFEGYFEGRVGGKRVAHPTSCRLGGTLDSRIWPAQQIADNGVQLFKIANDLSYFGYTMSLGAAPTRLFSADTTGLNNAAVSPAMQQVGVPNFVIAPSTGEFLYFGDARLKNGVELFRSGRAGQNLVQLNQPIANSQQGQSTEIQFSGDGQTVFYEDGQQESAPEGQGDIEMWLRSVPLTGGTPKVVNAALPLAGDYSIYGFRVSASTNRVAYLQGQSYPELYLSDADGRNASKPLGSTEFTWYESIVAPAPGHYLFIRSAGTPVNGKINYETYVVAFDGSSKFTLPTNWSVLKVAPSGDTAVIYDTTAAPDYTARGLIKSLALVDLATGQRTPLPAMKNPDFSADSKFVMGTQPGTGASLRGGVFSIATKLEVPVCPKIEGNDLLVRVGVRGEFFVTAHHAGDSVVSLYRQTDLGDCARVNSVPVAGALSLAEMLVSAGGESVSLKVSRIIQTVSHDQLYYVPVSGEIPMAINAAVFNGAKISSQLFLNDARTILFLGDQTAPGKTGVFRWQAKPAQAAESRR